MPLPRPLLAAAVWLLLSSAVLAQTRPAAPARGPAEAAPNCLLSEFRAMALGTHDVAERGKKAMQWLQRHSEACTDEQLRLLSGNRTLWLGNADSIELMGSIDGALEKRLKDKPDQLARMFGAAAPPPRPAGEDTVRSGTLAPRPAPVVPPGTPAVVGMPSTVVVAGVPGAPMPVQPGALARPSGAVPLPSGGKPPEVGRHFDDRLRTAVREFFTANRGSGACPAGLILKNARCESAVPERPWRLGQPLPAQASPKEAPPPLLEKLGAPPAGHSYVQVDGDLLLIQTATRTVVDAVLDLGQVPPKA
jgi:Ni/Co efflux regulator RcnB